MLSWTLAKDKNYAFVVFLHHEADLSRNKENLTLNKSDNGKSSSLSYSLNFIL